MPKRKLALVLFLTLGMASILDLLLVVGLGMAHKPYVGPLAGMSGFIPGFIVAALAWQGRLPSRCGSPS